MENDKSNWKNAFISSLFVLIGDWIVIERFKITDINSMFIVLPATVFLTFLPIIIIEITGRLKRG